MKEFAKKILSDVSSGSEFVLHYAGRERIVKNLVDLRVELESMSAAEFSHHVTSTKNDFATWISDVVGDERLGDDVAAFSHKSDMLEILKKRIDFAVSVIEKENKRLLDEELSKLKKLEKQTKSSPKIEHQIEALEKGLRQVTSNVKLEEKTLDDLDDLSIKPWHEYKGVHPHARLLEFIFGFALGLVIGMLFARVVFF